MKIFEEGWIGRGGRMMGGVRVVMYIIGCNDTDDRNWKMGWEFRNRVG